MRRTQASNYDAVFIQGITVSMGLRQIVKWVHDGEFMLCSESVTRGAGLCPTTKVVGAPPDPKVRASPPPYLPGAQAGNRLDLPATISCKFTVIK